MAFAHRHAKRVVLFNHKGGVGKTTLTVNLACALAGMKKRVLLVDTDPQCSLSSFFLEEEYLDKLLDASETSKGNTLWSALRPVSEGTGEANNIELVKVRPYLRIAVGDIRLSQYENSLADCWNQCLGRNRRGYICTAALSGLVDKLAAASQADFVFFDAGPNIGPLNRAVILDCTHFIVPAACDLFSMRALKTLGFAMSDWVATWKRIKEMAPNGTPVLQGEPRLLGFIPQGFRVYRGGPVQSSFEALKGLDQRVVDFVWKPMQEAYGLSSKDRPSGLRLGQVKFYGGLVNEAQIQGCPLWEVSGGTPASRNDARRTFTTLAEKLVSLTA